MVAEWSRLSRLMEQSIRARLDFDDRKLSDGVSRYSLLKTYLNDSVSRELAAQGQTSLAREIWQLQRKRYAELLNDFSKEVVASHRKRLEHRIASVSWNDYHHSVRSTLRIRLTIVELRVAFVLHGLGLSAGGYFASRACERIRGCFPPAEIVPITS